MFPHRLLILSADADLDTGNQRNGHATASIAEQAGNLIAIHDGRAVEPQEMAGIQTVGDLISKSEAELNAIPNFGKKSIDEVIETLEARGLSLRED